MASLTKSVKIGAVQVGVIEGEYEGKPTTSYTVNKQKLNQETKKWEDSPFLTPTDLANLGTAISVALHDLHVMKPVVKKESAPF